MNNEPELPGGVDLMPPAASPNGGTGILIALSLCTLLVHFLTNWRYGYFGDERYFIARLTRVLLGPNLLWEVQNGWVTLDAMRQSKEFNRLPFRLADFAFGNVMMTGPLLAPIAIAGLVFYFSRFGGKFRVLGISFVVTVAVMILSEGKVYYALPAYPALLAGGAVMIGKLAEMRRWSWQKPVTVSLLVASGIALAPGALPVLSPEALVRYQDLIRFRGLKFEKVDEGEIPSYLASMIGWENLVETVARAYQSLPPEQRGRTAILANGLESRSSRSGSRRA
jgi:hypothetical protein